MSEACRSTPVPFLCERRRECLLSGKLAGGRRGNCAASHRGTPACWGRQAGCGGGWRSFSAAVEPAADWLVSPLRLGHTARLPPTTAVRQKRLRDRLLAPSRHWPASEGPPSPPPRLTFAPTPNRRPRSPRRHWPFPPHSRLVSFIPPLPSSSSQATPLALPRPLPLPSAPSALRVCHQAPRAGAARNATPARGGREAERPRTWARARSGSRSAWGGRGTRGRSGLRGP